MTRNLEGIVLKKRNWRENDLEIIFLSKDWGKMRLLAIGARKFKSKLSGHLEPFNEVKIMLADGKTFDKIGQAVSLKNFLAQSVLIDWKKNWATQEAAELLNKILPEKQEEPKIYQLFKNFLSLISKNEAQEILPLFQWQAVVLAGFSPILDQCANCGGSVGSGEVNFSSSKGGLLCEKCIVKGDGQKINNQELKVLRHLVLNSGLKTAWIKLNQEKKVFLENLFAQFYSYHILK
ncbi:MAG: DNA repair protein RecO [Candidatus Magasanikbacteria bacterium]|nr:DNA repair protein RecO [Candidatus Magasanikbacteria bacterium]